ncbi:DHHC palmitoyltransferase-domain-containing protein [Aspergillus bertholletiae]|uniref:Palmitoyltransferase n=1 Tax=Aspergillus bertholletiae TaxID=1226010 RepID=A0A5N7BA17_9EURO|nr:DHHC palmitoyltransferase-domain-containing protein [Aspergillus bertholletiae]
MARPNRRVSLAVARIIPLVLLCAVIYASYVITKPLCIDYLITPLPKYDRSSRVGAGIAIIVVYYVLLTPMVITYLRLLYNVTWNPGFLPRGSSYIPGQQDSEAPNPHHRDSKRRKKIHRKSGTAEKANTPEIDLERGVHHNAGAKASPLNTEGLEDFYTKDVFICQPDGRPIYCSTCCQYKTDRAHHCREVDRCVQKMDHFCPWVGGVVSETSFKFFIQFVFYTFIFCTFALIVCAIFTAELRRETGEVNPHWAVGIGLSCLFGIFTLGMTLSSVQLAMYNLTTIENLNRRSAVWTLAIRVPKHMLSKLDPESRWAPTFRTITYPLPLMPPSTEATAEHQQYPPTAEQHVFAILQTLPGENPFDLGSSFKNLQQVLGYSVLDWLLPLKQSPCADHSSLESAFALGPVVQRLRAEAGLEPLVAEDGEPSRRKRRRSKVKQHS